MYVTNIEWDIDLNDAFEDFQNLTIEEQANMLNAPINDYKELLANVKKSYKIKETFIYNARHNYFDVASSLYNLPTNIDVPQELIDETEDRQELAEYMTDYISDEYGFCIGGYTFDDELEEDIERE